MEGSEETLGVEILAYSKQEVVRISGRKRWGSLQRDVLKV